MFKLGFDYVLSTPLNYGLIEELWSKEVETPFS